MSTSDYTSRTYLSLGEAAAFLTLGVKELNSLITKGRIPFSLSASGQRRFSLNELIQVKYNLEAGRKAPKKKSVTPPPSLSQRLRLNRTTQEVIHATSTSMNRIRDHQVHLIVTSPPYFNAKMYSTTPLTNDLGDIHDLPQWLNSIASVWQECYRVLQPGRKCFINIMNLPLRLRGGSYRTLNLVGKTIDLCESLGFVFKRDIIWQKTNGVRAHFGTYPYPGGILINTMHESILEFEKPGLKNTQKYKHVTLKQKEESKLTKDFWLSIKNSDVWVMAPEGSGEHRQHVAPFPLELPTRLIRAFSYIGETVLDPFAGSATTLLAAAQLGRNGIGYELNPDILKRATSRLINAFESSKHSSEKM